MALNTMKVAQALYEQGHITYMRTDSVALSEDYCSQARQWLQHDPRMCQAGDHEKTRAQEAIRPTHVNNTPDSLGLKLSEEAKLYSLIWNRAIASQCQSARLQKTRIVSRSGRVFGKHEVRSWYSRIHCLWNVCSSQLPLGRDSGSDAPPGRF